jgi:hypothetical protein
MDNPSYRLTIVGTHSLPFPTGDPRGTASAEDERLGSRSAMNYPSLTNLPGSTKCPAASVVGRQGDRSGFRWWPTSVRQLTNSLIARWPLFLLLSISIHHRHYSRLQMQLAPLFKGGGIVMLTEATQAAAASAEH